MHIIGQTIYGTRQGKNIIMRNQFHLNHLAFALVAAAPLFLSACGGGGGSDPAPTTTTPTPTQPPAPLPELKAQTITPFTIPAILPGQSVTVTAAASSGLAVSFTSDSPLICSVTPAGVVTAIDVGTCTIAANQFGNETYRQITIQSSVFVFGTQTISLKLPTLMVGETAPITPLATSNLPVALTSDTPSVCTLSGNTVVVKTTVPDTCTITARQSGSDKVIAAPNLKVSTPVVPNSAVVADGAMAVPTLPVDGSLVKQDSPVKEGFYDNGVNYAILNGIYNLDYIDQNGSLVGQFGFTNDAWQLKDGAAYLTTQAVGVPVLNPATGSGSVTTHSSLDVTSFSFQATPTALTLPYSISNSYAVTLTDLVGTWLADTVNSTGLAQHLHFTIDSKGAVKGVLSTVDSKQVGYNCALTGAIASADNGTSHNIFDVIFYGDIAAGNAVGCNMNRNAFGGHVVINYVNASSDPANGVFPVLTGAVHTVTGAYLPLKLYKVAP